MPLPDRGEWHLSNPLFGANPPFAHLEVNFTARTGRVGWTANQTVALSSAIAVIGANKFGAKYAFGVHSGLFEAEFHADHTLTVTFIGSVQTSCTARPRSGKDSIVGGGSLVAGMNDAAKIGEAINRSLPLLPKEAGDQLKALLTPEAMVIVTATLVVWAGSHFFGVGEIVDVILLVVGFVTIGSGVWKGAGELYDFVNTALDAQTEADLGRAAEHFAAAVNTLGVTTVIALLTRGSARTVIARGRPQLRPPPRPPLPPPGTPWVQSVHPVRMGGELGTTGAYGHIRIAMRQSAKDTRVTYYHEKVHQFLSPWIAPLRELRATVGMSAYKRSHLLRYLEEALAETYGLLRGAGLREALAGVAFPIRGGYVTIAQLGGEGMLIGNITVSGACFQVWVGLGPWIGRGQWR